MNNNTQAPPPTYQNKEAGNQAYYNNAGQTYYNNAGQTYYEPPPPQQNYAPPPNTEEYPNNNMGQRFVQFYSPPQNRKLGLLRRLCTAICCCIIIGLVIGLAAGLTSRNRYHRSSGSCNCRTNSDCIYTYGSGTYCYRGCQCAYR